MLTTEGIQVYESSEHGPPLERELRVITKEHDDFMQCRLCLRPIIVIIGSICLCYVAIGLAVELLPQEDTVSSHVQGSKRSSIRPMRDPEQQSLPEVIFWGPSKDKLESTSRVNEMHNFLLAHSISEQTNLDRNTTSQSKATQWMADQDKLKLSIPSSLDDVNAYRFLERYVLSVFFYALQEVQPWATPLNFLSGDSVCNWNSPIFANGDEVDRFGVLCHETNGDVSGIRIIDNNLTGTLPPELGLLGTIRWLYLDSNLGIQGSVPDSYENLKNLEVLTIQFNELTGSLPEWIGSWSNLQVLSLNDNTLTGTLPASMSRLTSLKSLALDNNMLSGYIGEIGTLVNLQRVYLGSNQFEGRIDDHSFRNHKALLHLDLSKNLMAGTVPPHFFRVENMTILDLHGNKLDGTLPIFAENTILKFLSLHDNEISERIPPSIVNLKSLTHLDITGNTFTHTIPTQLSLMSGLEYLSLENNPFTAGPVPDFSSLLNLTHLLLKATQISGQIPSWFGKLNKLAILDLGTNDLKGQMPTEIGNLESLRILLLNQNKLAGPIPKSFQQLAQLKVLFLDNNTITGLTAAVCAVSGLDVFLSDCGGPKPERECTCCKYCCEDAVAKCLEKDTFNRFDPIWNLEYNRDDGSFTGSFIKF